MATPKKPLAAGMTQAIGGMLVGVDQQIFRAMPRVEERFKHRDEVTTVASEDGTLVVTLPDAEISTPSVPIGHPMKTGRGRRRQS